MSNKRKPTKQDDRKEKKAKTQDFCQLVWQLIVDGISDPHLLRSISSVSKLHKRLAYRKNMEMSVKSFDDFSEIKVMQLEMDITENVYYTCEVKFLPTRETELAPNLNRFSLGDDYEIISESLGLRKENSYLKISYYMESEPSDSYTTVAVIGPSIITYLGYKDLAQWKVKVDCQYGTEACKDVSIITTSWSAQFDSEMNEMKSFSWSWYSTYEKDISVVRNTRWDEHAISLINQSIEKNIFFTSTNMVYGVLFRLVKLQMNYIKNRC